ncbi:MAG: type II toxin-antitoxin system HicB family antitoxin [Euryarchaeota archaeon]|nr:type II toxin-antitoxin system HicB family antitoxin [Euryarchaeota archaeon]MDE1837219.1 type II toxin-antitoxin system HicB family antitoxin [Euryarchaeota archaeon]MDE1881415.1 type II toxin-antitoxin system HicB family antitoxin [Euryarchaeota archaeon]MDE2045375.1 type II toxin-antitoxin system HicB family antitoxin [Thermoplasmata archaeon]
MATKYHILVEKDEDGWFVGTVRELPGCITQGKTEKQVLERMEEAILGYLETRDRAVPPTHFVILEPVKA